MTEEPIDTGYLAAVLAADYPLIDFPLILAILSDYQPSTLSSNLSEIRDQLGILEATLVPDPDQPDEPSEPAESLTGSTSLSGIDDLTNRLDGLNTSHTSGSGTSLTSIRNSSEGSDKSDEIEESVDESELLKSLFPSIPEEELSSALQTYPTLQDAIDYLLSLELIKSAEEEGQWPEEDIKVTSDFENDLPSWQPSKSKKSKPKSKSKATSRASSKAPSIESSPLMNTSSRLEDTVIPPLQPRSFTAVGSTPANTKKKKKKDHVTIALIDTLQRKPSPAPRSPRPMSRGTSATASRSNSPARPVGRAGPTNNPWQAASSLASHLSELIPAQPQAYFLTFIHSPEYHSMYSAVLASLAKLPKTATQNSDSRQILEDIYGISLLDDIDIKSRRDLERDLEICVHASGEDISIVMDLMDLLADISEWPNDTDHDMFETKQPDYTINSNSIAHPAKPHTISLHLPQGAVDMARTTSAGSTMSTISTKSVDDNSTTSKLPGKITRPEKKNKHAVISEEPHLSGGAIREAKIRQQVPGSKESHGPITHPTVLDHFGIQSPIPSAVRYNPDRNKQIHPQNWRTIQYSKPTTKGLGVVEKKLTVEQCMANAQLERARRETAIRAAGRSFRPHTSGIAGGGRAVKGAIAGHYAQQASEAALRAKEWELKATRIVVSSHLNSYESDRNGIGSNGVGGGGGGGGITTRDRTIDLHHLTIEQAKIIVNETINQWWKNEKELRTQIGIGKNNVIIGKFNIVTGVGRHSLNGKGVLGPAIAKNLENQNWLIDKGDSERGFLVVKGRR
ncbi:uncharacterized protein I206_104792 [Kwoniella pini CBS 10737]|uniref:Smr domain-containing protein n=1 Tax=Kwoniella pini CBS 10737 TaxID=1296096 RepID=A0A1B9I7Z7_9TREE|nr:uncharacterized protein I206_02331 [Kwoniella pini CBS 10737]OCF51616.1 hypothetical protein I206_02331 [Kwoniella pini CBS 10737]